MARYNSNMIVAIIPAYNEQGRVRVAIKDAARFVDRVVVVDDHSTDNTLSEAKDAGAIVLHHVINRGQGAALQTGTDYALNILDAEIIIHFDADGQMDAEEIPMLIEPILNDESDIVLGSRFLNKKANIPLFRWLILKGGIIFTRLVSGIKVTDTHNGFRVLSRKAASEIKITLDRMAHASEILDLIKERELRYVEKAVTIKYSEETLLKGQSSIGAIAIVKDVIKSKFL